MKTKQGTILGHDGRSLSVRYGTGVTDILLIRPNDCHGLVSTEPGQSVELRYIQHGGAGAWWHAFHVGAP